jgi:hypothetical protein
VVIRKRIVSMKENDRETQSKTEVHKKIPFVTDYANIPHFVKKRIEPMHESNSHRDWVAVLAPFVTG